MGVARQNFKLPVVPVGNRRSAVTPVEPGLDQDD